MFSITYGSYTLSCTTGSLPSLYGEYCRHAKLVSEFNLNEPKETDQSESPCFVGISQSGCNDGWPFLVVAQTFTPDVGGFYPGVILVPETDIVLIGAGTRLLAYTLNPLRLLWEDDADCGFWGWERHDNIVIMAAELEMAAWNMAGQKLWSRFVEPPWNYSVHDAIVTLDIMGELSEFSLATGPDTMP